MLFDLNVQPKAEFEKVDVCIVGSGPAGMALALELEKKNKTVMLMEGGGLDRSEESQNCYKGEVFGDPYFNLKFARLRYLGGTSNHWGGWCRSLDEVDFLPKSANEKAHWPIRKNDLDQYLHAACDILEISPPNNDVIISKQHGIKELFFSMSPPVRFKNKFFDRLKTSRAISLVVNASLVNLVTRDGHVSEAVFESFSHQTVNVNAAYFVFAMGGIENSRMLEWIDKRNNGNLLDTRAPIGRYWMEHPHFTLGQALVDFDLKEKRYFGLTRSKQNELSVLNCGLRLQVMGSTETKRLVTDLLCVAPKLGAWALELAGKKLICGVQIKAAWEQAPEWENRIELSHEQRDEFGIPLVELHWKKHSLDLHTVQRTAEQFNVWLMSNKFGRLKLEDWVFGKTDYPTDDELGGFHHMGGTRMATNAIDGVVDENCRVFGQNNLFVCGSSVFPTGGHANPTLTIVQLSLRLAEHLAQKSS